MRRKFLCCLSCISACGQESSRHAHDTVQGATFTAIASTAIPGSPSRHLPTSQIVARHDNAEKFRVLAHCRPLRNTPARLMCIDGDLRNRSKATGPCVSGRPPKAFSHSATTSHQTWLSRQPLEPQKGDDSGREGVGTLTATP